MESHWPVIVKNPTGNKPSDEFAAIIDGIPKIVFSHTLKNVEWESAKLAKGDIKEEVLALKQSHNGGSKDPAAYPPTPSPGR